MSSTSILQGIVGALFFVLLTALFMLYQNPLLEIHLANWGLC